MKSYDGENFSPPAPVAFVKLINPSTGEVAADVPMLLDSGADVTVLPSRAVSKIGISPAGEVATKVYDGSTFVSQTVRVHIKLGKVKYPGEYVLADFDVGFLGRDVLNWLVVELHGPARAFTLRRR